MNTRKSVYTLFGLVLAALLLVACGASDSHAPAEATQAAENATPDLHLPAATAIEAVVQIQTLPATVPVTSTPTEAVIAASYKLGDVINYGDVRLAVLGWRLSQGNENSRPAAGTKLVVVDVVLVSLGTDKLKISPVDQMKLRDASGQEYRHDRRFWNIPGVLAPYFMLGPGERVRLEVVFQVPETSGGYSFVYEPKRGDDAKISVELSAEPVALEIPAELRIPEANIHQIGQVIDHGDFTVAVLGWSPGDEKVQPGQGTKFIVVDVMVINRGSQDSHVSLSWTTLQDANLRQYRVHGEYHLNHDGDFPFGGDLGPGGRVRDQVAFQVPEASSGYVLTFSIGGDHISVDLGEEPIALEPPAELLGLDPNTHRVGEVIHQGDVTLAVLGWGPLPGSEKAQPTPGNKFVVVDLILANRGSQVENSNTPALRPRLQDADGYHYGIDPNHYYDRGDRRSFENGLVPGERVRGQFLYQVPEASNGYALIFDPGWLFHHDGGDTIVVALGEQPVLLSPPAELLTPYPGEHKIGDVNSNGGLALAVLGWQSEPGDKDPFRLPEDMRYVIVEAVLANQGQQHLEVRKTGLKDHTGQWYNTAGLFAEERFLAGGATLTDLVLAPGERVQGKRVFEVPKDTAGLIFTADVVRPDAGAEDMTRLFMALSREPVMVGLPAQFPEEQITEAHAIGETVGNGHFLLTVTDVRFVEGGEFGRPDEGNTFVLVDVTVQNVGLAEAFLDGHRWMRLKDEKGQQYAPDPRAFGHPVSIELMGLLTPSEMVQGQAGFQVPKEARALFFVFQVDDPEPQKVFISLSP